MIPCEKWLHKARRRF